MVVLNRIYTRKGDKGETSLSDGSRVAKHSLRVDAYGNVDETNATIGLARLHCAAEGRPEMDEALGRIQNDLFDVGADLARPNIDKDHEAKFTPLRTFASQVERLEAEIDEMNEKLSPLKSFTLPGGTPLAAHLHLVRTVSRRAERMATRLAEAEPGDVNPEAVKYLNRLSDWAFVASRIANGNGEHDVLWVPGANR